MTYVKDKTARELFLAVSIYNWVLLILLDQNR
ncbi:hypothetical protein FLAN108750_05615 [Flavobacterium antarcticum]